MNALRPTITVGLASIALVASAAAPAAASTPTTSAASPSVATSVAPTASTYAPRPTLRYGSQNRAVFDLQALLYQDGHYMRVVALDGDFGTQTLREVKHFQRTRGLYVDGVVGPKTWRALTAEIGMVPGSKGWVGPGARSLHYRDVGNDVHYVQVKLNSYYCGQQRVTNKYDGRTIVNVKRYQRENRLYVDGIVGPKTATTMFRNTWGEQRCQHI